MGIVRGVERGWESKNLKQGMERNETKWKYMSQIRGKKDVPSKEGKVDFNLNMMRDWRLTFNSWSIDVITEEFCVFFKSKCNLHTLKCSNLKGTYSSMGKKM